MKMDLILALLASTTLLGSLPALAETTAQASNVQHLTGRCLDDSHRIDTDVNCEVSAVVNVGQQLFFASDKGIPGRDTSKVFSIGLPVSSETAALSMDFNTLSYARGDLLGTAEKIEGLTKAVDTTGAAYVIATSAFTRADNEASNRILYWPSEDAQRVKSLGDAMAIREQIFAVVNAPFFQVEGISVAPGNTLLLGIRKQGVNSQNFAPAFIILKAPFTLDNGQMQLTGPFTLAFEFTPYVAGNDRPLSLSGLEYDSFNNRLLATTSFEEADVIGGYLWVLPMSLLGWKGSTVPQVVLDPQGAPLKFANKPEGVEILSKTQVLIVHDDDRVQVADSEHGKSKKPNAFTYSLIELRDN
ncbi:hypothetical protein D3C81_471660 [compost metagenome]